MKKILAVLMAAVCIISAAGCSRKAAQDTDEASQTTSAEKAEVKGTVTEDTKYGAAIFSISPEDFEKAGFVIGDSCNIVFDSGLTLKDVPFYNGYYVKNGDPVIVAYPNDGCIKITYNNVGIWEKESLTEGEGVTITLNKKGAYDSIQSTLGQVYSTDRDDYDSDESFCNFRALACGNLRSDYFYRGASPVDNSRGRAAYTDKLLKKYGIKFILDLADSEADMEGYIAEEDFNSPYTEEIYKSGNIALLDMGSGYTTDEYKQKVAEGFRQMIESDGPVYIHCMEGKDRTGFVCFLIEALSGATYTEMKQDYMTTYSNYYGVTGDSDAEKYNAIADLYFDSFATALKGTDDTTSLKTDDYIQDAADYLMEGGMSLKEVYAVISYITGA